MQDGEQRCAGASGGRKCPPGSCEVLPAPRTLLPLWKLLIMAEGMKLFAAALMEAEQRAGRPPLLGALSSSSLLGLRSLLMWRLVGSRAASLQLLSRKKDFNECLDFGEM